MNSVQNEIAVLEENLRLAELGPDPKFFEEALSDNAILVSDEGILLAKSKIVEAHHPGKNPKFLDVQMTDLKIIDHGLTAVVTCKGTYQTLQNSFTLKFMRVWLKKNNRWQIIAGTVSK
ncbi:MAG: nuclear transport factor 2 family protein [Nanoarchaeota archaeon]|nr:nuclear transport factor 2 family protein [Nanoarchaeota archaeon]